jgi:hypothetical protein
MVQETNLLPAFEPLPLTPQAKQGTLDREIPTQDFSKILGSQKADIPLFKSWAKQLSNLGEVFTADTDSGFPDYWIVYVSPTWSGTAGQLQPTVVACYQAADAGKSDPDVFLTGGGSARFPGTSQYLTVEARTIGTNKVTFGIIAVRKTDTDVYVYPGNG